MIFDLYNPVFNTIFVYIIILVLLILQKPSFIYDRKHRKFKGFGTSRGKSMFALPVLAIVLAVVIYVVFASIEKFCVLQDEYVNVIEANRLKI